MIWHFLNCHHEVDICGLESELSIKQQNVFGADILNKLPHIFCNEAAIHYYFYDASAGKYFIDYNSLYSVVKIEHSTQDIKFTSINDKEKQEIFSLKRLEWASYWYFSIKIYFKTFTYHK